MPRPPRQHPLRALPGAIDTVAFATSAPPVPIGLSEQSRAAWNRLWSSPIARVMLPALDTETVEMLLRLRDERDVEMRLGKKQRMVLGSQGQPVINPLLAHAIVIQKEIRAIEDRLGLNPTARLRLGILLGDATRSIGDVNEEFEQGELGDVDLTDDDAPATGGRG